MQPMYRFVGKGLATMVAVVVAGTVACGGRQSTEPIEAPVERTGAPCCLTERWEQPPPQIGDLPGETPAPEDALDPFAPPTEGSGDE